MEWFTRRHAMILARSSLSRLKYLEKTGIVVPHRGKTSPKAEVFYSWEQILEIRTIARLRQYLSFQRIRRIIQYFEDHGFERSLRDKHLLIKNGKVTWVRPDGSIAPQMIELQGKRESQVGQLVLTAGDAQEMLDQTQHPSAGAAKVINLKDFKHRLDSRRQ